MIKEFRLTKTTIPVEISWSTFEDEEWKSYRSGTTFEFNAIYMIQSYLSGLGMKGKQ